MKAGQFLAASGNTRPTTSRRIPAKRLTELQNLAVQRFVK